MSVSTRASDPGQIDLCKPLVFDVTGMDCGDCARSVERVVGQLPQVDNATVSFASGTLTVKPHETGENHDDVVRSVGGAVDRAGYTAVLREKFGGRRVSALPWWRNRKLIPAVAATVLWVAAFVVGQTVETEVWSTALYAVAIVVGGMPIMRSGLVALTARRIDMNVLMTISVIGAALLGEWSEGGLVVVLFSIGTTLQAVTFDRTRNAIRALLDLAPDEARVVRDGVETLVAVHSLQVDDVVRVRPGDRLPADGEVIDGHSAMDQAAITGESLPVERGVGDEVYAGTVNGSGTVLVRVTKLSSESMLANIVHLVEEAQSSRAPSQQLVDRFAAVYTPAVVAVAALIALGVGGFSGNWDTWIYRALVLLVIACPCALVISTPVAIVSAIGAATRGGMLVKGGAALEDAGRVKTVAFDKTGTLTMGRPTVASLIPYGDADEREVLELAAAVEQPSEHPLARAIVARALHDAVAVPVATGFAGLPGRGAQATVDGAKIVVGSDRLMREAGVSADALSWIERHATDFAGSGESVLSVGRRPGDGPAELLGVIAVADRVRPDVRESLAALRRIGVERIVMLTGDREEVASTIAAQVGVDEYRANLLPDEKSGAIRELQRQHGSVAMVGDGINDAPALATADVGIAMGVGGSDVALESADLALMRDDLSALSRLFDLSHRTVAIIRQNVTLSLVTKAVALLLGTLGFVNLWIAVLADMGTSIIVTLNGLRLARVERQREIAGIQGNRDRNDGEKAVAAD
ncbi:MAG: cadmium-translocating P-type ATPase [Chloroflexia bacterium]|nr:cadmium-translocating P-type ATPase [Chloroflexia bacterium]